MVRPRWAAGSLNPGTTATNVVIHHKKKDGYANAKQNEKQEHKQKDKKDNEKQEPPATGGASHKKKEGTADGLVRFLHS